MRELAASIFEDRKRARDPDFAAAAAARVIAALPSDVFALLRARGAVSLAGEVLAPAALTPAEARGIDTATLIALAKIGAIVDDAGGGGGGGGGAAAAPPPAFPVARESVAKPKD